jgi:fructose-specific phosphotransferase system IIC component
MASHFNFQGNPDGFMPKMQFFASQLQMFLVVVGLGLLIQLLFMVMPAKWINTPDREYWLIPEHHTELVGTLSSFGFALFGTILLVIQVGLDFSVYGNLQKPVFFPGQVMIAIIAGFFIFSTFLLIQLTRSFRHPPDS